MNESTRVANIGPLQRRRRRVAGAWSLAAAVALTLLSGALGWAPWLRLALTPLVFGGFSGVLQSKEQT